MVNRYLVDADPERCTARRKELKRHLAQRTLNKERIAELRSIVDKLDRDSDDAVEEHSIAAKTLQDELAALDSKHIDFILDGKTSPAKSLQRRSEILSELAKLNQTLEARCDANKRSKQPFQKQIEQMRSEVAKAATLESQMLELAGSKYRIQREIDEMEIQGFRHLLAQARRKQEIHEINHANEKAWDDSNRRGSSESTLIHAVKLEDSTAVVVYFKSRLDEALRASEEHQKECLAGNDQAVPA